MNEPPPPKCLYTIQVRNESGEISQLVRRCPYFGACQQMGMDCSQVELT